MVEAGMRGSDRLSGMDFAAHNAEVHAAWAAFHARRPYRVPVIFGTNTRYFMLSPHVDAGAHDFRTYTEDPDAMFDGQLRFQRWSRYNLLQDAELGPPERWSVSVDFQNYYEAAWFGCPIAYYDDQVPDTRPRFAERPEAVTEGGPPDPFGSIMGRALDYYGRFKERAEREEFEGGSIAVGWPGCGMGTDGPMTVACNLFGPDVVCSAMAAEPDRLHRLLDFITEATIRRMTAWRERAGVPIPQDGFGMADDSIALISTPMYEAHILPFHRRFFDALATTQGRSIHLCGDATRHFPIIRERLGVSAFDTGFPVDFGRLRRQLGPDVLIQGGPHVELLRAGSPEAIHDDVERICSSGVLEGGRFILREGNNLAPGTPLENTEAMYAAGRAFGQLADAPPT